MYPPLGYFEIINFDNSIEDFSYGIFSLLNTLANCPFGCLVYLFCLLLIGHGESPLRDSYKLPKQGNL